MSTYEDRDALAHRVAASCGIVDIRSIEVEMVNAVLNERVFLISKKTISNCTKCDRPHCEFLLNEISHGPLPVPEECRIRACFLGSLIMNPEFQSLVPRYGIWLSGAHIEGYLNLRSATVPFPLVICNSYIPGPIELRDAKTKLLKLSGSHTGAITASRLIVESSLALNNGFWSEGTINLHGATIEGVLDCRHATFDKAPQTTREAQEQPSQLTDEQNACLSVYSSRREDERVFTADDVVIKSDAYLTDVSASGIVVLAGAKITNNLELYGSSFLREDGTALSADRISVGGDVLIGECQDSNGDVPQRFVAKGLVSFIHAHITGDMNCRNAQFSHEPVAFDAREAHIEGSGFFSNGFRVDGGMNLIHAQVNGDLFFRSATLKRDGQVALDARGISVDGSVYFDGRSETDGMIRFAGGAIKGGCYLSGVHFHSQHRTGLNARSIHVDGTLAWTTISSDNAPLLQLDLRYAKVGHLQDDENSWPRAGNLLLDGFVYGDLSRLGTSHEKFPERLRVWLCAGNPLWKVWKWPLRRSKDKRTKWLKRQLAYRFDGNCVDYRELATLLSNPGVLPSRYTGMLLEHDIDWAQQNLKQMGQLSKIDERELLLGLDLLLNDPELPDPNYSAPANIGSTKQARNLSRNEYSPNLAERNAKIIKEAFPKVFTKKCQPFIGYFKPQPYEELAFFVLNQGDKSESIRILMEKEDTRRKFSRRGYIWRGALGILKWTTAYGYKPYWTGYYAIAVIILGMFAFGSAREYSDYMVPSREYLYAQRQTEEEKCTEFQNKSIKQLPAEYPEFDPFLYSLDVFLPIVDLHQQSYWIPSDPGYKWKHCPEPQKGVELKFIERIIGPHSPPSLVLHVFLWVEIIAGWILSTLFFAGFFGFLHTSELKERGLKHE